MVRGWTWSSVVIAGALSVVGCQEEGSSIDNSIPENDYCAAVSEWDPEWLAFENEVLSIVNQHRAAGANCGGEARAPVGPLTMDPALRCAARVHSKDMVDRGFFDHDNPDGESPWDRIARAEYDANPTGENIAAGYPDATAVMQGWMDSPGHCNNIMAGGSNEIGVGYYEGAYWTQTFGNRPSQ